MVEQNATRVVPQERFAGMRALRDTSSAVRTALAQFWGRTFGGKRDMTDALGYKPDLGVGDYRARYERSEVGTAIVEKKPKATWAAGAELIEDEDPDVVTDFERVWEEEFVKRLDVWSVFYRTDLLAGLGDWAVLFIGAPGKTETPLQNLRGPQDILYLMPFGQDSVRIKTYVEDTANPRFGQVETYSLTRMGSGTSTIEREVHWTRLIHVADGILDSLLTGRPRMRPVWNRIDDLEKVVGGGSEAFWMRAHQGYQFDIDKDVTVEDGDVERMTEDIDAFAQGMQRTIRTRGVTTKTLGSDVADFSGPADTVLTLIALGYDCPKRILMGSERGELASTQDRETWRDTIRDRRQQYAQPRIVRPFVERMISVNALPKPAQWDTRWPETDALTEPERVDMADKAAGINTKSGEYVIEGNEIRDRLLRWPKMDSDPALDRPEPFVHPRDKARIDAEAERARERAEQGGAQGGGPAV